MLRSALDCLVFDMNLLALGLVVVQLLVNALNIQAWISAKPQHTTKLIPKITRQISDLASRSKTSLDCSYIALEINLAALRARGIVIISLIN